MSTINEITNCPLCPRHCSIEAPSCGRGKALAEKLKAGENVDIEKLQNERQHERGSHGHGDRKHDRDSLEGLLHECVHRLHHRDEDGADFFAALSEDEKDTLKLLLRKLVEGEK